MESEHGDRALFSSSTEFLISFDSAEDTKPGVPVLDQHCEGSSAVSKDAVADDEAVLETAKPVKAADSEHIVCEFADDDEPTGLFPCRYTGAGESANSEDLLLSLMSCVRPDVHTDIRDQYPVSAVAESSPGAFADRKADYIKHSVDISSEDFTASGTLTDGDKNEATDQLFASAAVADHPITNECDSVNQSGDILSDFAAFSNIVTDCTNETLAPMADTCQKELGDDDKSRHMQLFNPFPDADEFSRQLNDGEHAWMHVSSTAQPFDQQIVESSDDITLQKREINTSLPDVHTSVTKQDLISVDPDQLISAEANPASSDLLQPAVDGAVAIEEIQVNSLDSVSHTLSQGN